MNKKKVLATSVCWGIWALIAAIVFCFLTDRIGFFTLILAHGEFYNLFITLGILIVPTLVVYVIQIAMRVGAASYDHSSENTKTVTPLYISTISLIVVAMLTILPDFVVNNMAMTFKGIALGLVIGLAVMALIVKRKAESGKVLSVAVKSFLIIFLIGASLCSGYLGRTALVYGEYKNESCDYYLVNSQCTDPVVAKFYDDFSTAYYCENHADYCQHKLDVIAGIAKETNYDVGEDSYGHDKFDAWTAAKDAVDRQLKSPSTAVFCRTGEANISKNGNTWTVRGHVDAQNSFGATLRNDFTVVITFTSETKYTIDSCRISAR